MATLLRTAHFIVQHHMASSYVQLIRTELPFPRPKIAEREFAACEKALDEVDKVATSILFDFRRAPMSTDPELHKVLAGCGDSLLMPFARGAFLLATRVGVMQTERISRSYSQSAPRIFHDESEALRFLADGA